MKKLIVDSESVGKRADVFVSNQFPDFSRSTLKGLFEHQKIHCDKKIIKPGYKLKTGETLTINSQELYELPGVIDFPIVYEDDDVVVVDKPSGVLTHSKGALNPEPTVASFIKSKISDGDLKGNRAGIVHRLDRMTSGVIIAAKKASSLKYLQKQFSSRKAQKTYLAIVEGVPEPNAAIIDAPIARNPKRPQTFRVAAGGKPARTRYKLLKRLGSNSLIELQPETGRTHQLRVHMAYIHHPVVGDAAYGHGENRMFLHAHKLKLKLPNGKLRTFTAKPPINFGDLIR